MSANLTDVSGNGDASRSRVPERGQTSQPATASRHLQLSHAQAEATETPVTGSRARRSYRRRPCCSACWPWACSLFPRRASTATSCPPSTLRCPASSRQLSLDVGMAVFALLALGLAAAASPRGPNEPWWSPARSGRRE